MKYFLIVLLALMFSYAWSCESPPEVQHVSNIKLIQRTSNIVLAKVISIKTEKNKWDTVYRFANLESIKGSLPKTFKISGYPTEKENKEPDFNHHTDKQFWNRVHGRNWGRSHNHTDCMIHPYFSLNAEYLIFYNTPYHSKSFEKISDKNKDSWLKYVREQTKH